MKIHFGKRAAGGEAGLTQVKPKHKKGKWTKRVIALVLAAALAAGLVIPLPAGAAGASSFQDVSDPATR